MNLKLKICGMKHNVADAATLQPDYLGFIFYEGSPRNFDAQEIPTLPKNIKKVGVFVDASIDFILEKIKIFELNVIQLHGEETPAYCKDLYDDCLVERSRNLHQTKTIELWKVFSIKDHFDFGVLADYESAVSKFLFDTKGKAKGGNGYVFDWNVLKNYPSNIPFVLSGGIGLTNISEVKKLLKTKLPIYAIDVNSKFEDHPGMKNISDLKKLKEELA